MIMKRMVFLTSNLQDVDAQKKHVRVDPRKKMISMPNNRMQKNLDARQKILMPKRRLGHLDITKNTSISKNAPEHTEIALFLRLRLRISIADRKSLRFPADLRLQISIASDCDFFLRIPSETRALSGEFP